MWLMAWGYYGWRLKSPLRHVPPLIGSSWFASYSHSSKSIIWPQWPMLWSHTNEITVMYSMWGCLWKWKDTNIITCLIFILAIYVCYLQVENGSATDPQCCCQATVRGWLQGLYHPCTERCALATHLLPAQFKVLVLTFKALNRLGPGTWRKVSLHTVQLAC